MRLLCLLSISILLFGNGCSLKESQAIPSPPMNLAERYLKDSRRKQLPRERRLGFLLAAAHTAWREIGREQADAWARRVYNASAAELAALLKESAVARNSGSVIQGPNQSYRVSFAPGNRKEGIWDSGFFDELLLPLAREAKSLRNLVNPDGFGGVLVGIHKPQEPRKWLLPRIGVSAPVTAIADFKDRSSPGPIPVKLILYDPSKRDRTLIARRQRPLTANFGAPLAYYPNPWLLNYLALIDAARFENREGLYLVQPYDPDKIPVVLIHGLMSIPQMWLPVMSQIEADSELRGKFQFWTFGYPTGDPEAISALGLRNSLRKAYEVYPKAKDMVRVSYSLGGLVGKMQVQSTGDTVWHKVFRDDAAKLWEQLPSDSLAKQSLIFEANPRINRIVFICTPHLGASLASGPLGQFGASIILLPNQVVRAAKSIAATIGSRERRYLPNSITGLSPKSPLLLALYPLPIQAPFHSIIGDQGIEKIPLKDSSDGVVPYSSSHLAGAVSERIVPAQHVTACQHPETIEELKRILRLHLKAIAKHSPRRFQ